MKKIITGLMVLMLGTPIMAQTTVNVCEVSLFKDYKTGEIVIPDKSRLVRITEDREKKIIVAFMVKEKVALYEYDFIENVKSKTNSNIRVYGIPKTGTIIGIYDNYHNGVRVLELDKVQVDLTECKKEE